MDILYSSSDSYAFLTGISILSLLENNRECDAIHIYIMDNHISDINKNKLIEVVKEYRRDISFVPMPDMKELTGQEIDTRRWNISTFGRLYMASALPKTVHKVLNIDCDTIIVDTIEPLWNTDMTGKVFGGMLECINDRYRRNVGKNDGDYYLNGGIVFLNLDEVRVGNYERKFTDYITKYGSSLAYLDQDVLNGVVEQEKKVKLPMRYNALSIYFYATYEQVLKIRRSKSQDFYSKEEFSEAISNPGLVHFTTCFLDGLRPWIKGNQHPYLKTFLKYKEMSPWRDIPLQEDKRSGLVKFRTTMIRKAPRFVLCEVASVLHGVIIPEKNYKRMNSCAYVKEAYEAKKWAFVSDYARFEILYKYGGLYFDTDVELVKSFDDIVSKGTFMGLQPGKKTVHGMEYEVNPGLGLGSEPGVEVFKEIIEFYHQLHFVTGNGGQNIKTIVDYTTEILKKHGMVNANIIQQVAGITVYPADFFCPLDFNTGVLTTTENTHSIHHFVASWFTPLDWAILKIERKFGNGGKGRYLLGQILMLPLRIVRKVRNVGFVSALKIGFGKMTMK